EPRLEQRRGDAVGRSQTEDEALGQALPLGEMLPGRDGKGAAGERLAITRRGLDVRIAHPADEAARAGSGGEVFGRAPVDLVVARAAAGAGGGGGLGALQAPRRRGAREPPVL